MIIYTSKDSFLEIPKGLGNLGGNGGGSDADLGPLSGSVVELSAVTESEAVKLAGLSASTENLASSVGAMATDLETVSGSVETLSESVDSQGDSIADLLLDVDSLDGRVSGNTSDIEALSAQTSANTADIAALSAATEGIEGTVRSVVSNVETISGQTSANTADIAALSGQVETLSSSTVNGLETAQNAANSADTKASSAYTLADSAYTRADAAYNLAESLTGGTGGPTTYVLNFMTQQERAALYAELAPYRWVEKYMAISSGFPVQDYAFYFYAGEETSNGWNDGDRGFVPLQLTAIHPDDYGGACFFTGTVKSRQGNNEILWVRYNVTSTGEVDKSTGVNNWYEPPTTAEVYINSDGSIRSDDSWTLNNIMDSSIAFRTWLVINDGTGNGRGQVLNWTSINEEVDTDVWTDVYYFSALVPVGTTTYKGQWRVYRVNDEWDSNHFAPASWVAQ